MDAAWAAGIRWFDTADAYGGGSSETFIGRWRADRRPEGLIVTTKVYNPVSGDPARPGLSRDRIRRNVEAASSASGSTDRLLPGARPRPETPLAETAGAFEELVGEGTIVAWGLSNHDAAAIAEALAYGRPALVQNAYSLLDREDEARRAPALRRARHRLRPLRAALRRLAGRQVHPRRRLSGRLADDDASRAVRASRLRPRSSTGSTCSPPRQARAGSTWRRWHSPGCSRIPRSRVPSAAPPRRPPRARPRGAGASAHSRGARPHRLVLRMTVRILSEHDVYRLLPVADCIEPMRAGAGRAGARGALQPASLRRPAAGRPATLMGLMPAYRSGAGAVYSLKTVCIVPGNAARGLDSHQGFVALFDGETGATRALVNAGAITAIRTAAVTAVATRLLARPGSPTLAILGSGTQGRSHLEAMRAVLPFERGARLEPHAGQRVEARRGRGSGDARGGRPRRRRGRDRDLPPGSRSSGGSGSPRART